MKPIEFPEQNFTATSNDENVKPLPVCVSPNGFQTISCWEVTDEDIERMKTTHKIYLSQMNFGAPLYPVFITSDRNDLFINPQNQEENGTMD